MALAFRISSPIAMFRKWWTTTSSVSYPFPPPTTIAGLIGAILGLKRGEDGKALYWRDLVGSQISVLVERFSYVNMGMNFIDTKIEKEKKRNNWHTQIMHQFLRRPSYVIFYRGPKEDILAFYLENRRFYYTPYLGTAYAIANIEYIGRWDDREVVDKKVDTVLPVVGEVPAIDVRKTVSEGKGLFYEKVDVAMDEMRRRKSTISVIYAKGPIYLKDPVRLTAVGPYRVAWFPRW